MVCCRVFRRIVFIRSTRQITLISLTANFIWKIDNYSFIPHPHCGEDSSIRFWPLVLYVDLLGKISRQLESSKITPLTINKAHKYQEKYRQGHSSITKYRNVNFTLGHQPATLLGTSCLSVRTSPKVMTIHKKYGLAVSSSVENF